MPTYRRPHFLTCSALALSTLLTTALPAWSQLNGTNYIFDIQGSVFYGRFLIRPDRASEGAVLSSNHQIQVGVNGRVTLVCSNGSDHALSVGTYRVADYCRTPNGTRPGARRNPSRDPFNTALPYVITPRNTALLAANDLTLRWQPVPTATQYQVTITGRGVNWTTTVNQPEVTYTGSATLQPDYRYTVIITTNTGLSSASGSPVGIALLPPDEVERVTGQVDLIKASQLEPDVEAIALVLVYLGFEHSDPDRQSYALNQSALDVLETRILAGSDNSQLYLLQADTYLAVGLPLLARERYEQGLALAEAAEQRELQAESHLGLATVAQGQTEYAAAIFHLETAQSLYEELGDREQVAELQTQIEWLSREVPQISTSDSAP